jgi:alpha-D-xyloside xylohydrolase
MREQVTVGLSMGIAGIPWWTMDIGGFHGGVTKDESFRELLVRWFEWGTFVPVMRLHGDRQPSEPVYRADGTRVLNSGSDNEIWSFGEEAEKILSEHILLREKMRDYTREAMRAAHETGSPVMRTLFFEFPEDREAWNVEDEFLFGPDVLVAPVLSPGLREREVYLPEGSSWELMWTGKIYEGGQRVTVPAPLAQTPVFLRDGKPEILKKQA